MSEPTPSKPTHKIAGHIDRFTVSTKELAQALRRATKAMRRMARHLRREKRDLKRADWWKRGEQPPEWEPTP